MSLFHLNSATGVVAPCVLGRSCRVPRNLHGSRDECLRYAEDERRRRYSRLVKTSEDESLLSILHAISESKTLSSDQGSQTAATALLRHPSVLRELSEELASCSSDSRRTMLAKIFGWVARVESEANRETPSRFFHREIEGVLHSGADRSLVQSHLSDESVSLVDLIRVSTDLWNLRSSSIQPMMKVAMFQELPEDFGYVADTSSKISIYSNVDYEEHLSFSISDLPDSVLAFDVETDTSSGMGLRPMRSRITEVVVSSKETSWVFSGDEQFILESFSALLNSQSGRITLAGWNNHNFDNIALQTRAELHSILSWRGFLSPTENRTPFSPSGPTDVSQRLFWSTSSGTLLEDCDLFQEKVKQDRQQGIRRSVGLKSFVESLGCSPIRVDRERLHEISEENRTAYALSDGIATLRAYKVLMDR